MTLRFGTGWLLPAGICAALACLVTLYSTFQHWKCYRKPTTQRYIIRILAMIHVFSIASFLCLAYPAHTALLHAVRELYEAFTIYAFHALLISLLGGERALLTSLHGRAPVPYLWPVAWWQREMDLGDPYTFLRIKRGVLQFVFVKPVCAITSVLIDSVRSGDGAGGAVVWWAEAVVTCVYNLSYSWCLWCLSMFIVACKSDLEPFRAVPKFLCIKIVVFFSYWQGLVIAVLVHAGLIHNTDVFSADDIGSALQSLLICLEMLPASVLHHAAFSVRDFRPPPPDPLHPRLPMGRLPLWWAIRDSTGVVDLLCDVRETVGGSGFNYHEFEPAEGVPGTYRRRIRHGVRYVDGGRRKYFATPNEIGSSTADSGLGWAQRQRMQEQFRLDRENARLHGWQLPDTGAVDSDAECDGILEPGEERFRVGDEEEDVVERLWREARRMPEGDFNSPVVVDEVIPAMYTSVVAAGRQRDSGRVPSDGHLRSGKSFRRVLSAGGYDAPLPSTNRGGARRIASENSPLLGAVTGSGTMSPGGGVVWDEGAVWRDVGDGDSASRRMRRL